MDCNLKKGIKRIEYWAISSSGTYGVTVIFKPGEKTENWDYCMVLLGLQEGQAYHIILGVW